MPGDPTLGAAHAHVGRLSGWMSLAALPHKALRKHVSKVLEISGAVLDGEVCVQLCCKSVFACFATLYGDCVGIWEHCSTHLD